MPFHWINLQRKEVVYVDSMYPPKSGRRSIATRLINTYFPTEPNKVTLSSFYEHRVQHDSHICGTWLIAGLVAYVLGIGYSKDINKVNIFNLMRVLVGNLDNEAKFKKATSILRHKDQCVKKEENENLKTDSDSDESLVTLSRKSSKRYTFGDSSDEGSENDMEDFLLGLNKSKSSAPKSNKKRCLDNISDIEEDFLCVVHSAPLSRDKRKEKIKINCVDKSLNSSGSISETSHNSNINDVSNSSDPSIMTERIPEHGILSPDESSNEDQNIETNKRSAKNCLHLNCASNTGYLAVNGYPIVGQKFMSVGDIITLLNNADDKTTVESILNGV